MTDPRLRQITIKCGILKRLVKQKTMCERKVDEQKARIDKLRSQGKDDYVLQKEDEILQETLMMVPDSHRRLVKALKDLNEYIKKRKRIETNEGIRRGSSGYCTGKRANLK